MPPRLFLGGGIYVYQTRSYWTLNPEDANYDDRGWTRIYAKPHKPEEHIILRPAAKVGNLWRYDVTTGVEPRHHRKS